MNIVINTAQQQGHVIDKAQQQSNAKKNENSQTVNAKNLHIGPNAGSAIDAKKQLARKQAMKLVGDAFDRDQKASASIKDMIQAKNEKLTELADIRNKIANVDSVKSSYMEEYNIDPDSQEQKDLELLEKYQNNRYGAFSDSFSEDELARLKQLQEQPLTEYQKKSLEANYSKDMLSLEYKRAENEVIGMTQSIELAKVDQLKSQDMTKATDVADQILDASGKEVMGMLYEEGKEHLEETAEEEKEKAEKLAEEKEEREERIEEQKEERKEQESLLEADAEKEKMNMDVMSEHTTNSQVEEAQKNIQKILDENNMINEEIKGIEIDLKF